MTLTLAAQVSQVLESGNPRHERFAVDMVDGILRLATEVRASDVHFVPDPDRARLHVWFRIDGILHAGGTIEQSGLNVVSRLKILSGLLTYRTDIPQEGRIREAFGNTEMRVSTFPTIHGEKAVVRLFVGSGTFHHLADLKYHEDIEFRIREILKNTSGLFLVCGPAGSGKTTTLYAALRELQRQSPQLRCICTLEDPVEAVLPGVSQSQVKADGEFDYFRGLASLLRQDPEVIMVGEIRDPATANVVFQASLTGHLVLSTFHAGGAADAVSRLLDMQIEPYILRGGLSAVLAQRLLRRCCECHTSGNAGCESCRQTGYRGRTVVAELLCPEMTGVGPAILRRADSLNLHQTAVNAGMVSLQESARNAIRLGLSTDEEFFRVFGPAAVSK